MPAHTRRKPSSRALIGVAITLASLGCHAPQVSATPASARSPASAPALSTDDEALLASLLAEDPSDFHLERARIWRIGPARWIDAGPELPGRPAASGPQASGLARPLEAIIVDPEGPRVLLPLDELVAAPELMAQWAALRIVAVLAPGDLVAGLTRELHPTPWLTIAAGVALTPLDREDDHLRARWSDPACGFSLELVVDPEDFGPIYEPGPAGPPRDPPDATSDPSARRLAPGTAIYAEADAREPVLRLDPEDASHGERMSAAQRVTLDGKPSRGRQPISLRCRGMLVRGFVESRSIVDSSARYVMVEDAPARASSCREVGERTITVPRATPLYEPTGDAAAALVGVVAEDVELAANPGSDGWWTGCIASPWGDLLVQFRLR